MARRVYAVVIEFYDEDPEDLKAIMNEINLVHRVATYARQYKLVRKVREIFNPEGMKEMNDADVCS